MPFPLLWSSFVNINNNNKIKSEKYFSSVESNIEVNKMFDSYRSIWEYRYFHFRNYVQYILDNKSEGILSYYNLH